MVELFHPIKEYFTNFEYSGEYLKHCMECGKAIEEGDYILVEVYSYKDNVLSDLWHPDCALKAEARMREYGTTK